ncbi:MAG: hypothetical protein ACJATA_002207 [Sphingobacteriales bacterium]|jgi:hypothetical protein
MGKRKRKGIRIEFFPKKIEKPLNLRLRGFFL